MTVRSVVRSVPRGVVQAPVHDVPDSDIPATALTLNDGVTAITLDDGATIVTTDS